MCIIIQTLSDNRRLDNACAEYWVPYFRFHTSVHTTLVIVMGGTPVLMDAYTEQISRSRSQSGTNSDLETLSVVPPR